MRAQYKNKNNVVITGDECLYYMLTKSENMFTKKIHLPSSNTAYLFNQILQYRSIIKNKIFLRSQIHLIFYILSAPTLLWLN